MEKYIKMMEQYAQEHHVPIMQKEGISFLQEVIQQHQVKTILEIGSAIGYSAIQMCRMDPTIHVVTIEKDEERYKQALQNIALCKLEDRIQIMNEDALTAVIEGSFDLIFIDAAKAQYIKFFERYESNLSENGLIVSDNLKFHGFVESKERIKNRNTRQLVGKIKRYITYLKENPSFDTCFYECGDGVAISKRKCK
ncbi:MAG: O-methyltransferase [Erysipelotrichia bacterium]|nr:O-methyltransferase [Erysipelotrichia bacterium]NCC54679.1 O-methyltransferase [Erysipelotrichia bacterium]